MTAETKLWLWGSVWGIGCYAAGMVVGLWIAFGFCAEANAEPYCFDRTTGGKTYRVCTGGAPVTVTGEGPGGVNRWAKLIGHEGMDYFERGMPPARHWHPLGGDHRDFVWGDDPWKRMP